jgi:SagB-type dehydrogenase family enzyme
LPAGKKFGNSFLLEERGEDYEEEAMSNEHISLPGPKADTEGTLADILGKRRSIRRFSQEDMGIEEAAALLYGAQGVNRRRGRTAPSAGALYPLELHLVAGNVESLAQGVYHYLPPDHALLPGRTGDVRQELATACLGQTWMADAPMVLAICAVYERVTDRYGERGKRYVDMEAGHAAQNVHLQAAALGLGTVVVGAFEDDVVARILGLSAWECPIALMPVGTPK